jgi:hypothetical protein
MAGVCLWFVVGVVQGVGLPSRIFYRLVVTAVLTGSMLVGALAQDEDAPAPVDPKFLELEGLPEGLRVTHSPNPVAAQPGGRSGHRYTWLYKTALEIASGRVVIEEFGYFALRDGQWRYATFTGKPFTPADFAEWYGCPGATIRPGHSCSDPQNWTGYQSIASDRERGLWYYIGRDSNGRRVKGQAIVELLAEVEL